MADSKLDDTGEDAEKHSSKVENIEKDDPKIDTEETASEKNKTQLK